MPRKSTRIEANRKKEEAEREAKTKAQKAPKQKTSTKRAASTKGAQGTSKAASQGGKKSQRSAKRVKTSKQDEPVLPTNPKHRGYLENFIKQAPLDVMLEIFSHLLPREILYLSRTTKAFRALFMSKSSVSIWRAARDNAKLPPLPDDLSEPRYASLAFDPYCQVCGRGPCDNIHWETRVKFHKKCDPFLDFRQLKKMNHNDWDDIRDMFTLDGRVWNHSADSQPFIPSYGGGQEFVLSTLELLVAEYKQVKANYKALKKWHTSKVKAYQNLQEHCERCVEWHERKQLDRKAELEQVRLGHANEVIGRLSEDGWELEDLRTLEGTHYSQVYQNIPFNEETWPDLEDYFVEALETIEKNRLHRQRKQVYIQRHKMCEEAFKTIQSQHQGARPLCFHIGDFMLASTKMNDLLWRPHEKDVSEEEIREVLDLEIPRIIDEWNDRREQEFLSALRRDIPDATVDTVRSFTALFQCSSCRKHLSYPRILAHGCFYKTSYREGIHLQMMHSSEVIIANWKGIFDPFIESPAWWDRWSLDVDKAGPRYSLDASNGLKTLLRLAGLDIETACLDDVVRMDPFFVCQSGCSQLYGGQQRRIMDWIDSLDHLLARPDHVLSLLDESEPQVKASVRSQIVQEQSRWKPQYYPHHSEYMRVECRVCTLERSTPSKYVSYRLLEEHLQSAHNFAPETILPEHWKHNLRYRPNARSLYV